MLLEEVAGVLRRVLILLVIVGAAGPAWAFDLGLDLQTPLRNWREWQGGLGVGAVGRHALLSDPLALDLEGAASYDRLAAADVVRARAGFRLGTPGPLRLVGFAHAGVGTTTHLWSQFLSPAVDVGGGLEWEAPGGTSFGLTATWNQFLAPLPAMHAPGDVEPWVSVGVEIRRPICF